MEPTVGQVQAFAYPNGRIPIGWLPCDGRIIQISDHLELFSLLGTTFGGDGQATFGLPDMSAVPAPTGVTFFIAVEGEYPRFQ